MKTVGKQLQDAREAKGWSPELAARETKIRVDRLHELESDDYSHFSSPTYARGFVRTYARSLGMDEYKILRQLDNKLPEDDNASFANDTGVPYMPEPSKVTKPFEVGRGVYVAAGIGTAVLLLIGFILIQVYRAGYFAQALPSTVPNTGTNSLPAVPDSETAQRALPADSNAPPVALPVDSSTLTAAPESAAPPATATASVDTNAPLRALPVNPAELATSTNASTSAPIETTNGSSVNNSGAAIAPPTSTESAAASPTTPLDTPTPPRAQPVDLSAPSAAPGENTTPAPGVDNTVPVASKPVPPVQPRPAPSISARQSNAGPRTMASTGDSSDAAQAGTVDSPVNSPDSPAPAAAVTPIAASVSNATVTQMPGAQAPAEPPAADAPPAPTTLASANPASATSSETEAIPVAPIAGDSAPAFTGGDAAAPNDASASPQDQAERNRGKRLVLTASHDSFVRVVALDGTHGDHVLFSSMLHSGQSISFNNRKYSINVGDPAVVDISLDGINYGPHSDHSAPDTFTVESRQP